MRSYYTAELKTLYLVIICSAEDLLTLNSNKFWMVYKVDGNPQLDSRDWSMYSNILNVALLITFKNNLNYAFTSNIRELIKFYNLGVKTFETDFGIALELKNFIIIIEVSLVLMTSST